MGQNRPALFRGRHFEDEIIILCVRWYLRFGLSYRDLGERMAERGLAADHSTLWRCVQKYAPMLKHRIRREMRAPMLPGGWMKPTSAWLAAGPIYIELIPPATPLISCFHRIAASSLLNTFCSLRCGELAASDRGSSTSTVTQRMLTEPSRGIAVMRPRGVAC